MKKSSVIILSLMCIIYMTIAWTGCGAYEDADAEESQQEVQEDYTDGEAQEEGGDPEEENGGSSSIDFQIGKSGVTAEDIDLHDIYGGGSNYVFTYRGEEYSAIYYYDNWCIYDSYKITSSRDMKVICQALIDEHPIHGKDYESYRTAEDMVYEWKQHNLAYAILPDDNSWKRTTGNVDFDPEDQGKSMEELYEDRTGQEFRLSDHKDKLKEYVENKLEWR